MTGEVVDFPEGARAGRTPLPAVEHPAQTQPGVEGRPTQPVTPGKESHSETGRAEVPLLFSELPLMTNEPGFFLCDRITVVFPVQMPRSVRPQLGQIWFLGPDGRPDGFRHRRLLVEGSWTAKVSIEVHDPGRHVPGIARETHLAGLDLVWFRLDGNPVKYFQGHNVFGSPDVWGLYCAFAKDVLGKIGLTADVGAIARFELGYFNRLDACCNFDLGAPDLAASLVRQLASFSSVAHRRSSSWASSLLFPGSNSSLSIYHKGPELLAHPPAKICHVMQRCADNIVRFEVVARHKHLDLLGLRNCSVWQVSSSVDLLFAIWSQFVNRLRFPAMSRLDVSKLTKPQARLYACWDSGMDVMSVASRATVFRHRAAILAVDGPDILLPRPTGDVVEFRRILRPLPASVPLSIRLELFRPAA